MDTIIHHKEKAKEIIEDFYDLISESDFHIPEFISGIPCADGGYEYIKLLQDETLNLAKQCAIKDVDRILNELSVLWDMFDIKQMYGSINPVLARMCYFIEIKNEIENYK
jgi:hypothetical protein